MRAFRDALRLYGMRSPTPELAEARRDGLTPARERRLRAAVRRGEPATTPEEARDAVAIAYDEGARRPAPRRRARLAGHVLTVVGGAFPLGLAVAAATEGAWLAALIFVGALGYLMRDAVTGPRRRAAVRRALAADRACLERAGLPPRVSGAAVPVWPRDSAVWAAGVTVALLYGVGVGLMVRTMGGDPLTPAGVARTGAWQGVVCAVMLLTISWNRHRRAVDRLHSAEISHQ